MNALCTAKSRKLDSSISNYKPKPIRDELDLMIAVEVIWPLAEQKHNLTDEEQSFFDVVCILIDHYETGLLLKSGLPRHRVLTSLILHGSTTVQAVAAATGISAATLKVLIAGNRKMTVDHIETLSNYFGVSPNVFFQEKTR